MNWKYLAIGIGLWLVALGVLFYLVLWIFESSDSGQYSSGCLDIVIQHEELSREKMESLLQSSRVRAVEFYSEGQYVLLGQPVVVFAEEEQQSCTDTWYTYGSVEGFRTLLQECGDICKEIEIREN